MDFQGAVSRFDFNLCQSVRLLLALRTLLLPPEERQACQAQQQDKGHRTHDMLGAARRLANRGNTVHGTAAGIGAGVLVKLQRQAVLIEPQALGIGTHVATREGVSRQAFKLAGLDQAQHMLGQVEIAGDICHTQAGSFASLAQGIPGIAAYDGLFRRLRRIHFCSERYCLYSAVPG